MAMNRWIDKENVVGINNGVLFNYKEQSMSSSVNLVKHHTKQNKQDSDKCCIFSPLCRV